MQENQADRKITEHPVLLFDGVCNLCNGTVQWIIRNDRTGRIHFASLQSEVATDLLAGSPYHSADLNSVLFFDQGRFFSYSEAPLRVATYLDAPWSWLRFLRIIPRSWRDAMYRWIARNRYRWFGKRAACMIPTPDLRARFLDA